MESLVLTVIGPDKPGLVESLSRTIASHGGGWEESRMARLAGEFAGILRVVIAPEEVAGLVAALEGLDPAGLTVVVKRGRSTETDAPARRVLLELVGTDRPGIVRDISHALATRGVNVEELSTEVGGAPWSGEAVFRARARLEIPPGLALSELQQAMEQIEADMMVDIELREAAEEA